MPEVKQKIESLGDKKPVEKYDADKALDDMEAKNKEVTQQQRLAKAQSAFSIAYNARRRYDWEWLARDLFRRGYQFSRYNAETKTLIMSSSKSTRIPVNLTAAAMRSIRNQVTTFRPKWEIAPDTTSDDSTEDIPFIQKYLDNIWRVSRLKKKVKELVTQGLMYSVGGPFQVVWDETIENSDGSKGNIAIYLIDPFDFYIDPKCTDGLNFSDAQFVIKAVRTPLDEVKTNPMYDQAARDMLTSGEMKLASSEYKQFLLQSLKFVNQTEIDENQTVILKEAYFKERDTETGKVKMRVMHYVDMIPVPLYDTVINETEFPFVGYQADMNPLEVYGESWARHVIAANKIINALESSTFDYNYRYAKGRLVVDKNSGVKVVTNEHGSIIEKNRGSTVEPLPLQPLPTAVENQLSRFRMYFEDISGVHEASMGRVPSGVKSGIGVAELKQSDATNQDDLVDNLEDCLGELVRKILKISAKEFKTARVVRPMGQDTEDFAVVGSKFMKDKKTYTIGEKEYKLARLYENNDINVSLGSWLAYSKEQRQEELKNLFKMGVIDQKTLLEHLEFGDVQSILQRTRKDKMLEARRGQPMESGKPTDEDIALSENEMMLQGREDVVPKQEDDDEVHIAVHQEALGQGMDVIINNHIAQHQQMMQQNRPPEQTAGLPTPTPEQVGMQEAGIAGEEVPAGIPPEILAILGGGGPVQ